MKEYGQNLIDNQIFKPRRNGLAICKCCLKTICFKDSNQAEYLKHFTKNASHIQYLANQNINCQNPIDLQNTKNQQSQNIKYKLDEEQNIEVENLFFLVVQPEAQCLWCNKRVIMSGSLAQEFICHFSQKSHLKYFSDIFYEKEPEEQICKQSLNFAKKDLLAKNEIKTIKKQDPQFQQYRNEIDKKEQFRENKYQHEYEMESQNQSCQFLQLVLKYFEFYQKQLIRGGSYLEAVCYILSLCGKDAKQICKIRFDDIVQEMRFLSYHYIFSTELQFMLQYSFAKLWHENNIINQGYLLKQPYKTRDLRGLLVQAKNAQYLKTRDYKYKKFLQEININQLKKYPKVSNQKKDLRQILLKKMITRK